MLNNSEIIFVIGKAIKRRQSRSSGEALQRSILQKEARINDNLSVDRVLVIVFQWTVYWNRTGSGPVVKFTTNFT
jgi:hypothetical protein